MQWRRTLIMLPVIAAIVALTPMAFASPPDPGWIAGFWDDGDYDDAVILVASSSFITETAPCIPSPQLVVLTTVCPVADQLRCPRTLSSRSSRAPPTI